MKGIILAGGTGSRMLPLTKVTNKHLLPVYNKPMIYYPLNTLISAGIKDIMIISGKGHAGHFLELLGSGKEFGVSIRYAIQDEAGGIAQALGIAEDFVDNDDMCVILGDNIFDDKIDLKNFKKGARLFLKEVQDPERFGVAELDENNKIIGIEEKPKYPKSNLAVVGLYVYDSRVFDIIKNLKPSSRGELEISDVDNAYIKMGEIEYTLISGFWSDAGTFESLLYASNFIRSKEGKSYDTEED